MPAVYAGGWVSTQLPVWVCSQMFSESAVIIPGLNAANHRSIGA